MKVVYLKKENDKLPDIELEIEDLEKLIRNNPANERVYNRLMILYRKQRNYKEELKVINRAIKTFEELFKKRQPHFNKKIKAISTALSKAMGLTDKKGNTVHLSGDLGKWKKRKELVSKKVKTKSGQSSR